MYDTNDPIEQLVHLYQDGAFKRRELIEHVAKYTGGLAAAVTAVDAMALPASAADACPEDVRVPEDAADLESKMVEIPAEPSPVSAYLSRPKKQANPLAALLVLHENRGLTPHIKDVTRRAARADFVAVGVDLLSRQGGSEKFPDPNDARQAYGKTTAEGRLADMLAAVGWMKQQPFIKADRIGVVGFCAGGANTFSIAVNSSDIKAAVPFYGAPPNPIDLLDKLSGAIMPIYAELDRNLTGAGANVLARLVQNKKSFGMHVYQGVGHAFHNDTGPAYNREAACDAWSKTVAFFNRQLKG